jgi:hypothetical protein
VMRIREVTTMRDLGRHKYNPGDVIGRWTVVRHASPVQRSHGRGRLVWRRRLSVRCECGVTELVLERSLVKGLSRGCTSTYCVLAHKARAELAEWQALKEHVAEMREVADVDRGEVAQRMIASVNAKLDRLNARLRSRWGRSA